MKNVEAPEIVDGKTKRLWVRPEGVSHKTAMFPCLRCGAVLHIRSLRKHHARGYRDGGKLCDQSLRKTPVPLAKSERYILDIKYKGSGIDIDYWVQQYIDKKETVYSLQFRGLYFRSYLAALGVKRSSNEDNGLNSQRQMKAKMGAEEYKEYKKQKMILTSLKDEHKISKFEGVLKTQATNLKKIGTPEELIQIAQINTTVKHIRKQIQKSLPKKPEEEEQPE